jgi:hypothetical protein
MIGYHRELGVQRLSVISSVESIVECIVSVVYTSWRSRKIGGAISVLDVASCVSCYYHNPV